MLSYGQHLALGSPWWSWDAPAVRKALWASVLARLRRLGNDRLAANRLADRSPADWRDLDVLRKEARTLRRVFDGTTNLCPELLLGYASLLGIDTRDCFPGTEPWVAEAATYLTRYADGRVRAVTTDDALVYAAHVIPLVRAGVRTSTDIEEHLARMPGGVRAVVSAVAGALAPVLEAINPEAGRPAGRAT